MPPRPKVESLPKEVRQELEHRLIAGGFAGYRELSEWLGGHGFRIGKSSLQAWGKNFEDRVSALHRVTEQARAIVAESPDEEGAVNDALIRLVQEKAYNLLMEMEIDPSAIDLPKLMRVVAELSRASVSQKRLAAEARKSMAAEVAAKVDQVLKEPSAPTRDRLQQLKLELSGMA